MATLVRAHQLGMDFDEILLQYPGLAPARLHGKYLASGDRHCGIIVSRQAAIGSIVKALSRLLGAADACEAHDAGLAVHVFTVDEDAELRRSLDLGVDGIFTNYLDRLRAIVDTDGWGGATAVEAPDHLSRASDSSAGDLSSGRVILTGRSQRAHRPSCLLPSELACALGPSRDSALSGGPSRY